MTHSTGMVFGNSVAIADKERKANEDAKKTLDDHTQDAMDELTGEIKIDHGIEINPSVEARKDPVDKDANNTVTLNRQNENEVEVENKQEHTKRIVPEDSIIDKTDDDKSNIATQGSQNDNDDDEKSNQISKQVRVMRSRTYCRR